MDSSGLEGVGLAYRYGTVEAVTDVSIGLRRGERLALAGPNGSGKTTVLRLLTGALRPSTGQVLLDGREVSALGPRRVARRVAMVAQRADANLTFPVHDLVAMGRTPYIRFLGARTPADHQAVRAAMAAAQTEHLAQRRFDELSGGEQQRVMLAMAMAQETDLILLDEPTVHLDLHHQHELLELLSRLQTERGLGVLAVMHDLNLSALYFDRLAVMQRGRLVISGSPADVLATPEALGVFEAPLSVVRHPTSGVPQVLLDRA